MLRLRFIVLRRNLYNKQEFKALRLSFGLKLPVHLEILLRA